MSDAAIVAGASVLLALAFVLISWRYPAVVHAPTHLPYTPTPEDPETGLIRGDDVRVDASHPRADTLVGYFPEVVNDDYIYAEVVEPSPDHEGDVRLETAHGGHSLYVPADAVEVPPTD